MMLTAYHGLWNVCNCWMTEREVDRVSKNTCHALDPLLTLIEDHVPDPGDHLRPVPDP